MSREDGAVEGDRREVASFRIRRNVVRVPDAVRAETESLDAFVAGERLRLGPASRARRHRRPRLGDVERGLGELRRRLRRAERREERLSLREPREGSRRDARLRRLREERRRLAIEPARRALGAESLEVRLPRLGDAA